MSCPSGGLGVWRGPPPHQKKRVLIGLGIVGFIAAKDLPVLSDHFFLRWPTYFAKIFGDGI